MQTPSGACRTAGVIDAALGDRLVRAAGFRSVVAHAYETLDMTRVHRAATTGPAYFLAFSRLATRPACRGLNSGEIQAEAGFARD